ncbi:MAG TPA: DNA polymerase III subunit delta, partial [Dehalococcoidia bacterium]|nr:DNA polymerase III subunit delta [Dehalococcoidia bacterium]
EAVIETIVSRCQVLNLKHVELEVVRNYLKQFGDLETEDLENIARLARGRIGWAH